MNRGIEETDDSFVYRWEVIMQMYSAQSVRSEVDRTAGASGYLATVITTERTRYRGRIGTIELTAFRSLRSSAAWTDLGHPPGLGVVREVVLAPRSETEMVDVMALATDQPYHSGEDLLGPGIDHRLWISQ
jgi:hypothetical protein